MSTTAPQKRPERGLRHRFAAGLAATLVISVGKLACRLPEGLLWRFADLAGSLSYRVSGARRAQARRNLRRVVEWMAANEVGLEAYRRAASDDRALESLVKEAFRGNARYYVEMARSPLVNARFFEERVAVENPEEVAEAFAGPSALILVAMHYGPIELPGFYGASRLGTIVSPMETIANDRIQRYLIRTRSSLGLHLIPLEDAAGQMLATLRRGRPVGIIGDRDLTGGGIEVELFGSTARIPAGPVLLAGQTGAPIYVCGVRRTGPGRYLGNLRRVPDPLGASRKERSRAMAQAEADLFERIVVGAPDQWLAVFHPIWPDLEQSARGSTEAVRGKS